MLRLSGSGDLLTTCSADSFQRAFPSTGYIATYVIACCVANGPARVSVPIVNRQRNLKRIIGNKKLLLVLDLDHTLLNSTRIDEVRPAVKMSFAPF
jgi:hypothetical protein